MPENQKPRPAFLLLSRGEKIAGWIYFPFFILLLSLILTIVFLVLGLDVLDEAQQLYMNVIYGGINFVVLGLCFRKYLAKSLRQAGHFRGRFLVAVAGGFAIYYFGNILAALVTQLIQPGMENINDSHIEDLAGHGFALMCLFTVILTPLAEELMFRGLIFSSLRPRSRFWAYAVSMTAFSLLHVLGYIGAYPLSTLALCLVQYLPAGFALAWALEYSGSIWASIGVHMLANTFAMLVMAPLPQA